MATTLKTSKCRAKQRCHILACPLLNKALAALLLPQSSRWSADRKLLPAPQHIFIIFELGVQLDTAAKNLAVLGVLQALRHQHDPPPGRVATSMG